MQNINVKRYATADSHHAGSVEPADRSWLLLLGKEGKPELLRLAGTVEIDGVTEDAYLPAGDPLFEGDGESA